MDNYRCANCGSVVAAGAKPNKCLDCKGSILFPTELAPKAGRKITVPRVPKEPR